MGGASINEDELEYQFTSPNGFVRIIVERKAIEVETLAKILTKMPGAGRIYGPGEYFLTRHGKVYHWVRTTTHQASLPGAPPAGDTGYLSASITHEMVYGGEAVSARVKAGAKYARYVELGTRYMEPRPFLRPALSAAMKG